jgi:hypothetical protein
MSSYRLDRVLLVIAMCKFCRGCVMQFGGSGATSGRQGQWLLHHDNALSHTPLVVQQFLSSPNHRTLRISLPVTSGCSLIWKWASREQVSQPWRTSDRMWLPNSGRFQKKPSERDSNNDRIDGARERERESVCVCVCARALSAAVRLTIQCNTTIPGTFWLPIVASFLDSFCALKGNVLYQSSRNWWQRNKRSTVLIPSVPPFYRRHKAWHEDLASAQVYWTLQSQSLKQSYDKILSEFWKKN